MLTAYILVVQLLPIALVRNLVRVSLLGPEYNPLDFVIDVHAICVNDSVLANLIFEASVPTIILLAYSAKILMIYTNS